MQAREKRLTFDSDTDHEECAVVEKERASLRPRRNRDLRLQPKRGENKRPPKGDGRT
jgi:hypothetical protein